MSKTHFDVLVYIGRFQPFHNGHLSVIEAGLQRAKQVIVLCSCAFQPRSIRNPWTADERIAMIRDALQPADSSRVLIAPLMDNPYQQDAWAASVRDTVSGLISRPSTGAKLAIGLIEQNRKQTTGFHNLFPEWGSLVIEDQHTIDAATIREAVFDNAANSYLASEQATQSLPANVRKLLADFCTTQAHAGLREEFKSVRAFKQAWRVAPYPPVFVTVDAVVVQNSHVLMVERKAHPGKGLLALPGGFVDQDETLTAACLRELAEETSLAVSGGCIKARETFDEPYRSVRGRTITHAFYIELPPAATLPEVKGGDDAKRALWVPLADLEPTRIFEDHYFIIRKMVEM